jgi:hypothetical protein
MTSFGSMHLKISADTGGGIRSNAIRRASKLLGLKFLISKVSVESNYIANRLMFQKRRQQSVRSAALPVLEDWGWCVPATKGGKAYVVSPRTRRRSPTSLDG